MNIFLKNKSRYVISPINGREYNLTNGHLTRYLNLLKMPIEEFLTNHLNETQPKCQCCDNFARISTHSLATPDLKWNWANTCGDKKCAIEMRRRGRKAVTKEQEVESIRKRNETFIKNPTRLNNRSRLAHEANLRIGDDGLTGYERTAFKRAKTLKEKYGRADFANWDKTKKTWQNKSHEDLMQYAEKIRISWQNKTKEQKQSIIDKREKTKIQKYGIPGWKLAFNASRGRRSKISDVFCQSIQDQIEEDLIFGTKEMNIENKFYDLTSNNTKKIIEFNGDYWHANPSKYSGEIRISMNKNKSAQEIWDLDAEKIKLAESHGYQVKIVWESDYKKNPQKIILECVEWLKR